MLSAGNGYSGGISPLNRDPRRGVLAGGGAARRGVPRPRRSGRRRGRRPRASRGRAGAPAPAPRSNGIPIPSIAARRSASIVSCGKPASCSASASARSRCSPGAVTAVISPIRSASSASTARPVRIRSSARPQPDDARQPLGPAVDQRHPPAPLEEAEGRGRRRQPQVAPERQLDPARQAPAVDRGDRRLRRGEPAEAHRPGRVLDVEVERLQVGARAERLAPGPGQDQGAGAVVGLEAFEALAQGDGRSPRRRRCGARAGRWSAPPRRRPVRSAPPPCRDRPTAPGRRVRAIRRSRSAAPRAAARLRKCGIGRASRRHETRGMPMTPGSRADTAPRSPVAEGAGSPRPPGKLGAGSDGASRLGSGDPGCGPAPGQPKNDRGWRSLPAAPRSLRDQKLVCATFETPSPLGFRGVPVSPGRRGNVRLRFTGAQGVRGFRLRKLGTSGRPRYPSSMRVDEIIASSRPTFSVEFFPPKDEEKEKALFETARELRELEPDFVSITYGAGGSTRDGTVEITRRLKDELGFETMAHLSCVGETTEGLERDARQDRGGRDRERLRAARRPAAGAVGLRPDRGRARIRRRAGGLHRRRALGLLPRRRLLPGGPPGGARPRHRPRLPEAEGGSRRLVPDHAALLRQPGVLRLRRRGAGGRDRGADHPRRHPGRQLRPDQAHLLALRSVDPGAARSGVQVGRGGPGTGVRTRRRLRRPAVRRSC